MKIIKKLLTSCLCVVLCASLMINGAYASSTTTTSFQTAVQGQFTYIGNWAYYFAYWETSNDICSGAYQVGNGDNEFALRIDSKPSVYSHAIQLMNSFGTEIGKEYRFTMQFDTNKINTIELSINNSGIPPKKTCYYQNLSYKTNEGTNKVEFTFTADSNQAQLYFGLGCAEKDSIFTITNVSVTEVDKYIPSDEFILGKNNNSFGHYNSISNGILNKNDGFSGFYNIRNYEIRDSYMKARLINLASSQGEMSNILDNMYDTWGGACYGIAATIGLVYLGNLSIDSISDCEADDFYHIEKKPYENDKLLSSINYYHLSQLLKSYGTRSQNCVSTYYKGFSHLINKFGYKNVYSNSNFYKKLLEVVEKNYSVLLGYMEENGAGHAILTCGVEQVANDRYEIKIFDENYPHKFSTLSIINNSGTYTALYDNSNALISELVSMFYIPLNSLYAINPTLKNKNMTNINSEEKDDVMSVIVPVNKPFKIYDGEGNMVEYDGESIDGNIDIYGLYSIEDDDNSKICLEITNQKNLTYIPTEDDSEVTIYNDNCYYDLMVNNVGSICVNMDEGLSISGEDYVFNANLNRLVDSSVELVSIQGKAKDDVMIRRNNDEIEIHSDMKMKDISINEISIEGCKEILPITDGNQINVNKKNEIDIKQNINESEESSEDCGEETIGNVEQETEPQILTTTAEETVSSSIESTVKNFSTNIKETTGYINHEIKAPTEAAKPAKVTIKSAKNIKRKSIIIKFDRARNAKSYKIQYASNKRFKKSKTVTAKKLTYIIKRLKKGKTYWVRVRGVNGKVKGTWSKRKKIKIKR